MLFIFDNGLSFSCGPELDDLLVEYKNTGTVSKSEFEGTLAGIEHVLPTLRGKLPWAHAVASAWSVSHTPKHTTPMCEGPAVYLGCHLAAMGHGRLGAGVIIQQATGMRPSELLGLLHSDVMLPEDRSVALSQPAVLALGMRHGTKAKRAQTVTLGSPKKVALLRWLRSGTLPDDAVVGYTYEQYRRLLMRVCEQQGLGDTGFSPHSPRSGFASDCISAGLGYNKTRELGRWVSESSLRTYVDLASAAGIQVNFKLRHLNEALAFTCRHMLSFFLNADQFLSPVCAAAPPVSCASTDAPSWQQEAGERPLCEGARLASLVDEFQSVSVSEALGVSNESHVQAQGQAGRGAGRGRRSPSWRPEAVQSHAQAAPGHGRGRSGRRAAGRR